jgi:dTDP-4-dehydrorhamnose reductase
MRIFVTGASGILGSYLAPFLAGAGHEVYAFSRQGKCSLEGCTTGTGSLAHALHWFQPEVAINLAALTDVDACERNSIAAIQGNVTPVRLLTAQIQRSVPDCRLLQISTDQVYEVIDPGLNFADNIEQRPNPVNIYGYTKLLGEYAAMEVNNWTVIRTNFFGRSRASRKSFTDWLFASALESAPLNLWNNVFFSPLSMATLAKGIAVVLDRPINGVFNLGSRAGASKYDFAKMFLSGAGFSLTTTKEVGYSRDTSELFAKRPHEMRMNVTKFERAFDIQLPSLESEIDSTIREYL